MAIASETLPDMPLLEQAALWFDRTSGRPLSKDERDEFERWRSDPDHALAFAEIEAAHADAKASANAPDMLALRHEALSRIVMPRTRRRRRAWFGGAIAASLAGLIAIANWSAVKDAVPIEEAATPAALVAQPTLYQTAVGEQLTVSLPDGSSVSLNTDSRLRLAYSDAERRLILDKGQALFHVAKGQARPFIVQALDRIVTAHGTTFDVRIDPGRKLKVSLIEGAVSVAPVRKDLGPPANLLPNDVLVASAETVRVTRDPDIDREVSWKDGLIVFEDESLAQATAEVNRYVKTPIVLEDDRLRKLRVSGAFRTGETDAFVEALQLQFPVKVVSRSGDRIVLASRS